jgi:hypothetical protein
MIMLVLSAFFILFIALSITNIRNGRKQFGKLKYRIHNRSQKLVKIVALVCLLITFIEISLSVSTPDHRIILSVMLVALATFLYSMNNGLTNGISENGLFLWGGFVSWEKIKRYRIDDEMIVLTITNIIQKTEIESNIEIAYDQNEKSAILDLFNQHIGGNT